MEAVEAIGADARSGALPALRHDWSEAEVEALLALPFAELMFRAQTVHRRHFDPNQVQMSTLLSIKTGGCPEDCAYCPQSARYDTGLAAEKMMSLDEVLAEARRARDAGATRYCMGAAWRSPKDRDLDAVADMVEGVKALGMETCVTLGMLSAPQAARLADAGLDYYNHNLDTSEILLRRDRHHAHLPGPPRHPRSRARRGHQRLLRRHRRHGESKRDRADMIATLASLPVHPESVPINMLVAGRGHAARRHGRARSVRVRAHGGGGAHHHAALDGSALRRARADVRRDAGVGLPRRRELGVRGSGAADDGPIPNATGTPGSSPASASSRCPSRLRPRRFQRSP